MPGALAHDTPDLPQAVTVEALYHKSSGSRTALVLTFDARDVPAVRQAPSGASLTAIVHAPTPGAEYHIVAWTKPTAAVAALMEQPPAPTAAMRMSP